jgi:hypothetical protein
MIELPLPGDLRLVRAWPFAGDPPWPWRRVEETEQKTEVKKIAVSSTSWGRALIYSAVGLFLYLAARK